MISEHEFFVRINLTFKTGASSNTGVRKPSRMTTHLNAVYTRQLVGLSAVVWFMACSPSGKKDRSWSAYKADAHSSSFSPLKEINVSNAGQLKQAWTFTINDLPKDAQPSSGQCNPIIVDGVMYATSAKKLAYAIDAATGKLIWSHDPYDGGAGGGAG